MSIRAIPTGGTNRLPASVPAHRRFDVLQRDMFTCQYCGYMPADGATLQVDHIIPMASGGTSDMSNLVTACGECNQGKSAKRLESHALSICGFNHGKQTENTRLRDLFLNRLAYGYESLADVVAAVWPEPD